MGVSMRGQNRLATPRPIQSVILVLLIVAAAPESASAWTLKTLHAFCGQESCSDGDRPVAGLVMDSAGNLYGTTQFGGANNRGVVFELKSRNGAWRYRVMHSFCADSGCPDGSVPSSGLILDVSGNLYGTTETGG